MIGIIIQARSGSSRFPGKIFTELNGKYPIQRILSGLKKTIYPNKIILAMPLEDRCEIEKRIAEGELDQFIDDRFNLFIGEGNSNDLVDRFYKASRKHNIDIIVRITADCPMHEGYYFGVDEMLHEYIKNGEDGFMGNNLVTSTNPYPCGIDVEIFNYDMICWTKIHAKTNYDLEHCVPMMYSDLSPFKITGFTNNKPHTMISTRIKDFSFDTKIDYELLLKLTESFDKIQDLNKAIESVDLGEFKKTNMSKNFK